MSVASDVADTIKTKVVALAFSFGGVTVDADKVVRRKVPTLPAGTEPPQVVIWIQEEGDPEYLSARKNLVKYPCALAIITAGGRKLADDEEIRSARQTLRQEFDDKERVTFAAIPQRNRVTWGGKNPFAQAALPKDVNVSVVSFVFEALEEKAS